MTIKSLDHVQLAAPPGCEVAARRFFGELLGLIEVEKPEALKRQGGVWFAVGSQQLHIGVESGQFLPARKAHPALISDGLDALAERLRAAGHEVTWDDAIAGRRRFFTFDPWGNRIELLAGDSPRAGAAAG
jgi:catechol 2,3-dioxygenase-like lactoylglutathione lyase family enzyme